MADTFWGEHATAYHVKNRGLVIISSCGHAGIINSIRQIQKATRIEKIHAVVGAGIWHRRRMTSWPKQSKPLDNLIPIT